MVDGKLADIILIVSSCELIHDALLASSIFVVHRIGL
jgi:hypothetical protein